MKKMKRSYQGIFTKGDKEKAANYNPDGLHDQNMWGAQAESKEAATSQFWGAGKKGAGGNGRGVWRGGGGANPAWWGRSRTNGASVAANLAQTAEALKTVAVKKKEPPPPVDGPELLEPHENCPILTVLEKRLNAAKKAEYKIEWKDDRDNEWLGRATVMEKYWNQGAINQFECVLLEEVRETIVKVVERAEKGTASFGDVAKKVRGEFATFSFGHIPKEKKEEGNKNFMGILTVLAKEFDWEVDKDEKTITDPKAAKRSKRKRSRSRGKKKRSRSRDRGRRRDRSRDRGRRRGPRE